MDEGAKRLVQNKKYIAMRKLTTLLTFEAQNLQNHKDHSDVGPVSNPLYLLSS